MKRFPSTPKCLKDGTPLEKDEEYDITASDKEAPWFCPECEEVWAWDADKGFIPL
jgi:hypothetical protein